MAHEIYLPSLHYFENKNHFSGSCGMLRFMLTPTVVMKNANEVELSQSSIFAQIWHGIYSFEHSEMEKEETFPMGKEGIETLREWLASNV